MRIAVVGAGISGLGAAWRLARQGVAVTLFEANAYAGGHTHTVDVTQDGVTHPVDTGFLVYNDRTYPQLVALFDALGVDSVASEMSFSCRVDADGLEWAGTSLATLFAQRRNLLRPAFYRMLADILRFNRATTALHRRNALPDVPLRVFLDAGRYGEALRDWYLLPMAAAIWSAPRREILGFPLPAFVQFCHNHGLLQFADRPRWRTVAGGGRVYVERMLRDLHDVRLATPVEALRRHSTGVEIDSRGRRAERFDAVVLACHSDQALRVLADPAAAESQALASVRYQANRVLLHTDVRLLPRERRAWSAWNYLATTDPDGARPVAVSYLVNKLQPLPFANPVILTLNPSIDPAVTSIIAEFEYAHPLLDAAALRGQRAIQALQGVRRTWYAGAHLGFGFHEDGLASGHAAADAILRHLSASSPAHEPAPVCLAA
ncbi:MAG: FAD-dependent oxidoreductase [Betaproteobacteria bacterium]